MVQKKKNAKQPVIHQVNIFKRGGGSGGAGGDYYTKEEVNSKLNRKENLFRYLELPTPTSSLSGKIFQYIGETTDNYKKCGFYQCVGEATEVVSFESIISCSGEDFFGFLKEEEPDDYATITHGYMVLVGDDTIRLVGLNNSEEEVISYQQYQADWENIGFTFDGEMIVDEQIGFTCSISGSTYRWEEVAIGGSGDATLEHDIMTNVTVGGISSGTLLPQGMTFTEFVDKVYNIYKAPTLSMSSNKTLLNKKGTTISQPIQIKATSGKQSNNIVKTAITFGGTEVASGTNPAGETVTYNHLTNITTDTTFNSSVNDGKQTITSSLKFEFIVPFYYGVSDSTTISSLTGLTEILKKKSDNTITISPNNQYVVYMYDASYGNLKEIKTPDNFDYSEDFTRSDITIDGQAYKCYVLNNRMTDTNYKFIFNF